MGYPLKLVGYPTLHFYHVNRTRLFAGAVLVNHFGRYLSKLGYPFLRCPGCYSNWANYMIVSPTWYYNHLYLTKLITPKVLRPYFVSPCRKWHKKGSSPRNHSNAEVLRPRVYSNVVGFHGRGFIAMSWVLRPRVYSNVRWRSTHDYSRFTHDYRAAICTF